MERGQTLNMPLVDKLAAIKVKAHDRFLSQAEELDQVWRDAKTADAPTAFREALERVEFLSHKMCGVAGIFDFAEAADETRKILDCVRAFLNEPDATAQAPVRQELDNLLERLADSILQLGNAQTSQPDNPEISLSALEAVATAESVRTNRLLIVEDDELQAKRLLQVLEGFGFVVEAIYTLDKLADKVRKFAPNILLMDIVFSDARLAGAHAVKSLIEDEGYDGAIIFTSVRDDFEARLHAVRWGGLAYIPKPINVLDLVDRLYILADDKRLNETYVLVIDDDDVTANYHATILAEAGHRVVVANSANEAFGIIRNELPALMLIDIYMPECDGIELVGLIRQLGGAYLHIPGIFLTASTDPVDRTRGIERGGDDFLMKPISPEHLTGAVKARLDRSRSLQEAQLAVRRNEARLRTILEKAVEAIIMVDANGLILAANPSAASQLKCSEDLLLGRSIADFDPEPLAGPTVSAATEGETIGETILPRSGGIECFISDKNGGVFAVEMTVSQVSFYCRDLFTLVLRNIGDRLEIERKRELDRRALEGLVEQRTAALSREVSERQAAQNEADLANRAKTEMLMNASHELRTPLNAIRGFSQMIASEIFGALDNERYVEYAHDIDESAGTLAKMIENLLDLSKAEFGGAILNYTDVDLHKIFSSVEQIVRGLISDRSLDVRFEIPKELPPVLANGDDVQRILINLLSNSVKFTPGDGSVRVSCKVAGDKVSVTVADTGIGIPADKIATITEPFVRAESSSARHYEGTGLGLTLVQNMVHANGGELTIHSVEGKGTEVTFTLPLSPPTAAA